MTDNNDEGFSLADLADLDVSDIKEIRFETLPQGSYEFEIGNADLEEGTDKDGAKRFNAIFPCKIVEVLAVLEPGVDKDSLIDKVQTEKFFINPGVTQDKIEEAIGRIRAFVSDTGNPSDGKLLPMIKNTKGNRFKAKISHQKDKDDKSIVYARIKFAK